MTDTWSTGAAGPYLAIDGHYNFVSLSNLYTNSAGWRLSFSRPLRVGDQLQFVGRGYAPKVDLHYGNSMGDTTS